MDRILLLRIVVVTVLCAAWLMPAAALVPATEHMVHMPLVARAAPPIVLDLTFEFSEVVSRRGGERLVAVAFRTLVAIDAAGRSRHTLSFGTPEAVALQGDGWYGPDMLPNVGTWQWAGGSDKRATMQLTVPGDTEGVLLDVAGVKDGLWMDVTAGDAISATLRVDQYWHSGYVPIGKRIVEPTPDASPQWSEGHYFPSFPEAKQLYSLRM